jgi:hypothetical protein
MTQIWAVCRSLVLSFETAPNGGSGARRAEGDTTEGEPEWVTVPAGIA